MKSLNGAAIVAAWGAVVSVAFSSQRDDLPKFEEIYSQHIEAIGGIETLALIDDMTVIGQVEIPSTGMTAPMTTYERPPALRMSTATLPELGEFRSGISSGIWWSHSPNIAPTITPAGEAANKAAIESVYSPWLDPRDYYPEIKVLSVKVYRDRPCYEVSFKNPFLSVLGYYDVATSLPIGLQVITPTLVDNMWNDWKALQVPVSAAAISGVIENEHVKPLLKLFSEKKRDIAKVIEGHYKSAGRSDEFRPAMRAVGSQADKDANSIVDQLGTRSGARPFPISVLTSPSPATPIPTTIVQENWFDDYKAFDVSGGVLGTLTMPTLQITNVAGQQQMILRVSKVTFEDVDQNVFDLPRELVLKVGPTPQVIDRLRRKSEVFKNEALVFKGLYLGMPITDAALLLRHYLGAEVFERTVPDSEYGECTIVSSVEYDPSMIALLGVMHLYQGSVVIADASGEVVQMWIGPALANAMFKIADVPREEFLQNFINAYGVASLSPVQVEWKDLSDRLVGLQNVYVHRDDDKAYEIRFYEDTTTSNPLLANAAFGRLMSAGGGPQGGFSVSRIRRLEEVLQSFD